MHDYILPQKNNRTLRIIDELSISCFLNNQYTSFIYILYNQNIRLSDNIIYKEDHNDKQRNLQKNSGILSQKTAC